MTLNIVPGRHSRHYWKDDAPDYLDGEEDIEEADRQERIDRELDEADRIYNERIGN